jgi:transposase InsO family protein
MATCVVQLVNKHALKKPLLVLFDSGSNSSWIKAKSLPKGVVPTKVDEISSSTLAGEMKSNQEVKLERLVFPEFFKTRVVDSLQARVFHTTCRYDVIIGRDFLTTIGLTLDFKDQKMSWDECHVPMREYEAKMESFLDRKSKSPGLDEMFFGPEPTLAERLYYDALEADLEDDDTLPTCDMTDDDCSLNDEFDDSENGNDHAVDTGSVDDDMMEAEAYYDGEQPEVTPVSTKTTIGASRYEDTDLHKVCRSASHLSQDQQNDLFDVLSKYTKLFDNKLGTYTDEKIHLDLRDDAVPTQTRAYAVPHNHRQVFKDELDRLVKAGVLEPASRSEWISGTFIIPKKLLPGESTPRVRWVSDFRGLNKGLKRKVYPIPRIGDILARRTGYAFLSKLDISMQYYTFELDDESKELCTIATPFGLYRYKRLPMGVSVAPDIAQEIMEKCLRAIEDIECYIDDIGIFSKSWKDHLKTLDEVCTRLEAAGFTVNPLKCEFAVKESDFLGHWLTPQGVKPLRKKIQGILDMQPPSNLGELRSFLGMVTYYRDMWPRRSHILAPLTDLLGTKTFVWTESQAKAFVEMKAVIARDTLLHYPDHNKKFVIETDASDYQLGGRVMQDGKDVAFYTRKLNSAQKNYTTIEKELLSIVETLKTFRHMLLGAEIEVYTDHKNLTYKLSSYSTQRVLRWRLLLEEYGASFFYKKGSTNVVADALSRVPTSRLERESSETFFTPVFDLDSDGVYHMVETDPALAECLMHDPEIAECFLQHPVFDEDGRVPFNFISLEEYQNNCPALQATFEQRPERFYKAKFGAAQLICISQNGTDKIVLTQELLPRVVKYYHEVMAHAEGMKRLAQTIKRHFFHRNIEAEAKKLVESCTTCNKYKRGGRVYGEAAPRDASVLPWQEVHCDSIGPWKIELRARTLSFHALTMIDPATNLVEIKRTLTTTAAENAAAVENTWLARYPRPVKIVSDQGPEFSTEFSAMCALAGCTHSTSTSRNPQGNSLIERIHQTIGQVLRTVVAAKDPKSVVEGEAVIEATLATAMHACRCVCSESLAYNTPGGLAFGRDMFLDIPLVADIMAVQQHRQLLVDKRLLAANAKRIRHDYCVGDLVWKLEYLGFSDKLKPSRSGPFEITRVHTNGTVTIALNDHVSERINIRRIRPKFPLQP